MAPLTAVNKVETMRPPTWRVKSTAVLSACVASSFKEEAFAAILIKTLELQRLFPCDRCPRVTSTLRGEEPTKKYTERERVRGTDRQTDTVADPEDHAKRVWGLQVSK